MSLCVLVVVGGTKYQRYMPLFIYFCFKSYPDVGIKIFLLGKLLKKYKDIINELSMLGDVTIKENCFSKYPKSNQELKTLRWVLDKEEFGAYNNIYIGDVDLLICREAIGLEEQHLIHCLDNDLPYSNMVRPNSKHRLSGLHFMKKDSYYAVMSSIIDKYDKLLLEGKLFNQKNETILYNMVKESGIGFPQDSFRPHHGLHLGFWRNGKRKRPVSDKAWGDVGKDSYKGYLKYFEKVIRSDLYKKIYKITPLKEIKYMMDELHNTFKENK